LFLPAGKEIKAHCSEFQRSKSLAKKQDCLLPQFKRCEKVA
jgi:hypothetical protein